MTMRLTKNQSLILSIFFANPGKTFYLRELSRMMKKEPGVFQKDINNLEAEGILNSSFKGKSRFFELNRNYPLYNEIKGIIKKTTGIEKTIEQQLKKISNIERAFIYGSFAQGTADNFSDIDLIIIGDPPQNKLDSMLPNLEKQFNREINYTLYSPSEFQRKKKSNPFLKGVLDNKIIDIIK